MRGERLTGKQWRERAWTAENRVIMAKSVARNLWALLQVQTRRALWDQVFNTEGQAIVDPVFEAVMAVFEQHHIWIEPCRKILDDQSEMYIATWRDGTTKNLTRQQVLMMGGQDPEAKPPGTMWMMDWDE